MHVFTFTIFKSAVEPQNTNQWKTILATLLFYCFVNTRITEYKTIE